MLLGRTHSGALRIVFQIAIPTIVLAFAVSAVLGLTAVWWTAAMVAVTTAAWLVRQLFGRVPAALQSASVVLLPWFLSLAVFGVTAQSQGWRTLALLALLWYLHNWGEDRLLRMSGQIGSDKLGVVLLAIAEAGIALLLISTREPLWLAVLVILWLPTWLALFQRRVAPSLRYWWLFSILASALAVGQAVS